MVIRFRESFIGWVDEGAERLPLRLRLSLELTSRRAPGRRTYWEGAPIQGETELLYGSECRLPLSSGRVEILRAFDKDFAAMKYVLEFSRPGSSALVLSAEKRLSRSLGLLTRLRRIWPETTVLRFSLPGSDGTSRAAELHMGILGVIGLCSSIRSGEKPGFPGAVDSLRFAWRFTRELVRVFLGI